MINRRLLITPPALLSRDHSELLAASKGFSRLLLETANMRVVGIDEWK
jgi:hypothetical protein